MLIASNPLWTDYLAAVATIVGIVIAAAALVMAKRSAADATRSAATSERTARAAEQMSEASVATLEAASGHLELARTEHERLEAERARRPRVDQIELSEVEPRGGEEAPTGIFRVGFMNSGDRPLVDAILTILVDPGLDPLLTNRWGQLLGEQPRDETQERWPGPVGDPRAFDYIAIRLDAAVGLSLVQYVCARRFGRFPVRIKLFSASLDGGGPWIDAWVDIDAAGKARIARLPSDQGGKYAGRLDDLADPVIPDN